MSTINLTSKKGTSAVKRLREQKLRSGLPFMINVRELSTNQCYLEYPNGIINLIAIAHSSRDMEIIRELTSLEADLLRDRFHFTLIK